MLVLTFQTGSERLALDVRQVREVVPQVGLQPVASGPPGWRAYSSIAARSSRLSTCSV